jgi:two-component system chemotaxis response regulator CheY
MEPAGRWSVLRMRGRRDWCLVPKRKRVLIVDDDPAIRSLIRTVLLRTDFEVSEAKDGVDAIDRMATESFDAVILDLMMPRKSGYEVIEFVRQNPQAASSIVVVSAGGPQAAAGLDRSRLAAIVNKPFDVYELVRIIARCIEEHTTTPNIAAEGAAQS